MLKELLNHIGGDMEYIRRISKSQSLSIQESARLTAAGLNIGRELVTNYFSIKDWRQMRAVDAEEWCRSRCKKHGIDKRHHPIVIEIALKYILGRRDFAYSPGSPSSPGGE